MFPIDYLYKLTFDRCLAAGALYEYWQTNPEAFQEGITPTDAFNRTLVVGEKPYTDTEFELAAGMVLEGVDTKDDPWPAFVDNWKETISDSCIKMQEPIGTILKHLESIAEPEAYPWVAFVGKWIEDSMVYAHHLNVFAENAIRLLDIGLANLPNAGTDTWVGWPDKPNQATEVDEVIQLAYQALFDDTGKFRSLVPSGLVPNVPLYIAPVNNDVAIGINHQKGVVWINYEPE